MTDASWEVLGETHRALRGVVAGVEADG